MAGGPLKPQRPEGGGHWPPFPWTPLERSIFPSLVLAAVVLLAVLLLFRLRLPPLPYSLVVLFGLWLLCFIVVYLWQVQRLRGRRR
jgi:hypothetical protein